MKTKNYLKLILLFSLICTPFFGQQTSKDHEHEELPCDQTVHGTFHFPILMHCEEDIFITSLPEDGNTGTIIYGGLESDTRIQILPGHTSVRIIPWEEENDSIGNVIQTHTTTRLRNGNLGIVEDENYNYTDTEDKSSSKKDKKIGKETVKVFPNPADGFIQLKGINDLYNSKIKITNVLGKEVFKSNLTDSKVNISNLKSGIYILTIQSENKLKNIKFIK